MFDSEATSNGCFATSAWVMPPVGLQPSAGRSVIAWRRSMASECGAGLVVVGGSACSQPRRTVAWAPPADGLSALPGCGKTTLGLWIEAADVLGLSLQVVSLDDFYFEADRLDAAMHGNPWGVPRALPGSHDLRLLHDSLLHWRQGQEVLLPCFDKSKRKGRGDRSGWRCCDADLLILEGWFVGCSSVRNPAAEEPHLKTPLTPQELDWRQKLQPVLAEYEAVWNSFDQLWQLRANDFNAPLLWKRQQEATLQEQRGASLSTPELERFIRMILCSLPSSSFQQMAADVVVEVDPDRNLRRIHLPRATQDSPSSDSLTG